MSFLGLFDYPKEIRQLRDQMPTTDRDKFVSQYKKLPEKEKNAFKQALRNADSKTASAILGEDLTAYTTSASKAAAKTAPNAGQDSQVVGSGTGPAKDAAEFKVPDGVNPNAVYGSVQAWKVGGRGAGASARAVEPTADYKLPAGVNPTAVYGSVQAWKVGGRGAGLSANDAATGVTAKPASVTPKLPAATAQNHEEALPAGPATKTQTDYRV